MRQVLLLFLYLNIYTAFTNYVIGQELIFDISAEKEISKSLKDSIDIKKTHIDFRAIETEANRIETSFRAFGYIESELKEIIKINDSTFSATYFLGPKFKNLKVYYNTENFSIEQISAISNNYTDTYFIIPISKTEKALTKLNSSQVANGNAFAKLKLMAFQKNNDTITATLFSKNGITRKIDSIAIKGYNKFPRSFIKHYAGIKKDKPFNRDELLKKSSILNNLSFSKNIKAPEILFKEEKTTVYLYLEKNQNNAFDGILGFASKEDGSGLELNGYIHLELNNNLNSGEQLLINYKADGEEQRSFRVKATLPYIAKSPIGVSMELNLFRKDSTFSTNKQNIKALYQANPALSINIGYKTNSSSKLEETTNENSNIEDFEGNFAVGGFVFKQHQKSNLFPLKSKNRFEIELGTRNAGILTDKQVRIQNIFFYNFNLNKKNSIFIKNNTYILNSENYLTNELFRFGGINSMRGFSENSIDASFSSVLNTEYRYILSPKTYMHSIIDVGYFENEAINQKEKLYSFGIGLGLETKAGLFKFNFANGNIEGQDFKFSNSKIHFSIITKF